MKKFIPLFIGLTVLLLASCAPVHDFNYFQDVTAGDVNKILEAEKTITIKPYDRISVLINSKDMELAQMFNLLTTQSYANQARRGTNLSGNTYTTYYTVSKSGEIDMPILGKVSVAGLTRSEISQKVQDLIVNHAQGFKDPTVTVDFANLSVKMLGELKNPGSLSIDRDQFTILDAIAGAGDLTVYGNRKNVKVFRNENGAQKVYEVDLTKSKELVSSPVYMLQQNDVVYVEPNKVKARQSTANGNTLVTPSFWMSAASFLMTVIVLFTK